MLIKTVKIISGMIITWISTQDNVIDVITEIWRKNFYKKKKNQFINWVVCYLVIGMFNLSSNTIKYKINYFIN